MRKTLLIMYIIIVSNFTFAEKIKIKTEIYAGFTPIFFEENGEIKGYGIDLINEINSRTNLFQITYKKNLIPLNRVKKNLQTGKIDLILLLAKNPERDKIYYYLNTPWYNLQTSLYTFSDNYTGLREISDKDKGTRVLGILGSNSAVTAKANGLVVDTSSNFESLYRKFLSRRWKYFVHINILADSFLETKNASSFIKESIILRKNSHYSVFKKNISNNIVDEFERVVMEIKKEKLISKFIKKY